MMPYANFQLWSFNSLIVFSVYLYQPACGCIEQYFYSGVFIEQYRRKVFYGTELRDRQLAVE